MMDIGGQLFLRETSSKSPSGQRVFMVIGLVAVPDSAKIVGERQYFVTGTDYSDTGLIELHIGLGKGIKVPEAKWQRADQILCSRIWRLP